MLTDGNGPSAADLGGHKRLLLKADNNGLAPLDFASIAQPGGGGIREVKTGRLGTGGGEFSPEYPP